MFDKKDAPLAAAAARRSEDYWEVDPDLGAVVRHHAYPRKRLYVPTPEDAKEFPTMSSQRLTELDTGQVIQDDINCHASAKQQDLWTGRTYFPIVESGTDELKLALAARKVSLKGPKLMRSEKPNRADSEKPIPFALKPNLL